eukprot:SAG31_NODE_102_length_25175_cov_10.778553_13_plen_73_part_00
MGGHVRTSPTQVAGSGEAAGVAGSGEAIAADQLSLSSQGQHRPGTDGGKDTVRAVDWSGFADSTGPAAGAFL